MSPHARHGRCAAMRTSSPGAAALLTLHWICCLREAGDSRLQEFEGCCVLAEPCIASEHSLEQVPESCRTASGMHTV